MPKIDPDFRRSLKIEALSCLNINVRKASRLFTRYFDAALKHFNLTSGQYSILVALGIYAEVGNNRLADLLELDRTTLTRNLKPLEADKLISFSSGEDNRTKLISLTPKGAKLLEKAHESWQQAHTTLVDSLGEEQWRNMIRHLHTMTHQISNSKSI